MPKHHFLDKISLKTTTKNTKNTSIKNLYCAEKQITKILLTKMQRKIIPVILSFCFHEKIPKNSKTNIKPTLITPFIPSKKSQFTKYSIAENWEISSNEYCKSKVFKTATSLDEMNNPPYGFQLKPKSKN